MLTISLVAASTLSPVASGRPQALDPASSPSTTHLETKSCLEGHLKNKEWQDDLLHLSDEVRQALRVIPYPIAIVTSGPVSITDRDQSLPIVHTSKEERLRGLLVSSFNTITLDPVPYVSFNIRLPSSTWQAILETGKFEAHMMWDLNAAANFVAPRTLAGTGEMNPSKNEKTPDTLQKELMRGRLFGLACELNSHQQVGDHVLVTGKVTSVLPSVLNRDQTTKNEHHKALLWCQGGWHEAVKLSIGDHDTPITRQDTNIGRQTEDG